MLKLPEALQRSSIQPLSSLNVSIRDLYNSHGFSVLHISKENKSPLLIFLGKTPSVAQIPNGVIVFVRTVFSEGIKTLSINFTFRLAWETVAHVGGEVNNMNGFFCKGAFCVGHGMRTFVKRKVLCQHVL